MAKGMGDLAKRVTPQQTNVEKQQSTSCTTA